MKKYILLPMAMVIAMAALLLSSCTISITKDKADAEGEMTKETRKIDAFNQLHVAGSMDITYIYSDSAYLELEGTEHILKHLVTTVNDSVLRIHLDQENGTPLFVSDDKRTIHIRTKDGNVIPGDSHTKVKIYAPYFKEFYGQGSVDFKADSINVDKKFAVHLAGCPEFKVKSITCENLTIETAGSSNVKTTVNSITNTEINIAGSSDADIKFNNCNSASLHVAGAANLTLSGDLKFLKKNIAGACDLNTDNLKVSNN